MSEVLEQIARIRVFNQFYARRAGLLTDDYLGQGRPTSSARVLFEIGRQCDVGELRNRLGLEPGHLGRLLRSLESDRLIQVRENPEDRRVRTVRLTPAGVAARADLDERARTAVATWLQPLTAPQRDELDHALAQALRLLRLAEITVSAVDREDLDDARRCLQAYGAEVNGLFPEGYNYAEMLDPEEAILGGVGTMFLARERGLAIGCALWVRDRDGSVEIRHMWVHPDARDLGLGRKLLGQVEDDAASAGVTTVRLYSHRVLTASHRLYRTSGYAEIPPYNDSPHSDVAFEKHL